MRRKSLDSVKSLTRTEKEAILLLKEKLDNEFNVSQVILFGSKARGDHTEDSDVDIMVLVDDTRDFKELRSRVSKIQSAVLREIDSFLMTKVDTMKDWLNPDGIWSDLKLSIDEEGILLEF